MLTTAHEVATARVEAKGMRVPRGKIRCCQSFGCGMAIAAISALYLVGHHNSAFCAASPLTCMAVVAGATVAVGFAVTVFLSLGHYASSENWTLHMCEQLQRVEDASLHKLRKEREHLAQLEQ